MKTSSVLRLLVIVVSSAGFAIAQNAGQLTETWNPVPRVVTPGHLSSDPPSDAIVLFDGRNFSEWESVGGKDIEWKIDDNAMVVSGKSGDIRTKQGFGDCQLHIEWRSPSEVKGHGQERGNSGVYLMGRYELQVLDSYENPTYTNGQAGSIYKQYAPLVNACRKPGEWQSYDIIFTAPRFSADSTAKEMARMTVFQNGVLIQNNATVWGNTFHTGIARYFLHSDKEPILLQDHGNPVSYRNVWIRPL
jgi:hypothetical protein